MITFLRVIMLWTNFGIFRLCFLSFSWQQLKTPQVHWFEDCKYHWMSLFVISLSCNKQGLSAWSEGLCDLFPSCVARGCSPRATHEGNKSHNHELKADKRDVKIHWRKMPLLFVSLLFFNTPSWHWWYSQVSRHFNYVSFSKSKFKLVFRRQR